MVKRISHWYELTRLCGICWLRRRRVGFLPTLVRVEARDRGCALRGLRTEVLLVDVALVAHDEGLDAGLAVRHRPGDGGEAADHATVHDVIVRPARCRRPLAVQQAEI